MNTEGMRREPPVVEATEEIGHGASAAAGQAEVADADRTLQSVRDELARIVAAATSVNAAKRGLAQAQALARPHAGDVDVRIALMQLRETAGQTEHMFDEWAALLAERPADLAIVRHCAAHLLRERRPSEALALVDRHMAPDLADPRASLARAEMLADIRAHDESDALFRQMIERHDRREHRIAFAKRLQKRGLLASAHETLAPIAGSHAPETKAAQLVASVADDYAFYRRFESEAALAGKDIRIVAMKQAILSFRNRPLPARDPAAPLSIALLTGSLGPGGAERQLTRLACHLHARALQRDAGASPPAPRPGSVEVIVKRHTDSDASPTDQRLGFFAGTLQENGVPVTEIDLLPAIATSHQAIDDANLRRLVEKLPAPVHYGVTRLAPYLRERRFDVASLWQDGTCLFGALAALLAGVPVIHLVFRGLPPNIRRERHRPEYDELYRALAEVPGVQFAANSQAGAEEYARWLGLPRSRFHILYNGVPELDAGACERDEACWQAFASRTQDATETIGGVFRFEPDKRPLLFIKLAARYLKRRPRARFLIVGDGRLIDNASALAAELGVTDRLLLVGLSSHVGFWYSKMDAKILLSRFEGLPNVLIEAQLQGIPTLATPAGGAGECFVDGVTGHLLDSAEHPDLAAACDKLAALVDGFQADHTLREYARQRARLLFSVDAMIGRFIELCAASAPPARVDEVGELIDRSVSV